MDLAALRQEYIRSGLQREDLADNPFNQFDRWMGEAIQGGLLEPNAMILATVDETGRPATRTVLLKQFDERGMVFYTNLESAKARHLATNPHASLLFPWFGLERQVAIGGHVEKVGTTEALKYFMSRPLGSRLGAWSSPQSQIIGSRSILEAKLEEMKRKFLNGEVPLPSFWGGFRVVPETFEFWQGRQNRLHDRFLYRRLPDGRWSIDRLAP